jgi:hypothetical protein
MDAPIFNEHLKPLFGWICILFQTGITIKKEEISTMN